MKTIRCTTCRAEFTDEETEGVTCCPNCGSEGLPMAIADDVTITINWHELRILGMWASNYANEHCEESGRKALAMILHQIACQHPERAADSPLTLAGEIALLADLPGFTLIETNVKDLLEERPE